ncbi:hypothetical protein GCM10009549_55110 [Streptomyces thermoalcalitolerans]|uniref:Uncharacterized protein n=1 Tax=Streptomyces thermoalcalitolerans TaxID=65605 RepID=A0ABP4A6R0_9ACTN
MGAVGSVRAAQGLRIVHAAWRGRRVDARGLPPRGVERARVPGVRCVRGGAGSGAVPAPDKDGGWEEPETGRCTTRLRGGRVVVGLARKDGVGEPPHPLRVRRTAEG